MRIEAGTWWVNKNSAEVVTVQINMFQTIKRTHFIHRLRKLFAGHPGNSDVIYLIGFNIKKRGIDRCFRNLCGDYLAKVLGQGKRKVAVAAVKLKQIAAEVLAVINRPAEHFFTHFSVGLGKTGFYLLILK